jgi:DNA helicase-2/ATP-dependent DNA helicase PcrA
MEKIMILNNLNQSQRQAVSSCGGPVLVLAGPGSGKTRVLTQRIAYLVCKMGVRPYHIAAVTFTNKAAREMANRLEDQLGDHVSGIWLGTFHSICARILRREVEFLPLSNNFVIIDADDQISLVKRALADLNLDEKLHRPQNIHAAISNAKNNLYTPSTYPAQNYREEVVLKVYKRYQELLRTSNAVDFDDLILMTVRLLEENTMLREKYARQFEHVLVDEFQDTNMVQYRLLGLLASFHKNLFVVGDEDQSIYRWRGADYRNVLRFENDFPNCQKILLEENYRSTQNILDAARSIIDRNMQRTPKRLVAFRGKRGDRLVLYEAADDRGEAAYVVETIQQWMGNSGKSGEQFAVMYRTNAQSRLIEEAFMRSGMPYRLVGAQRFYGRKEVKDLIAYLRIALNPDDIVSLRRVINVPTRGIGDKTIEQLETMSRQAGIGMGKILIDLGKKQEESIFWNSFSKRAVEALADFGKMIAGWNIFNPAASTQLTLPALFDRILENTGYEDYINDNSETGFDRWGNVMELRRMAYEYEELGIIDFLERLALVADQDTLPDDNNAPTLLTLHAAKGLEFDQVFIVGMDEEVLPHSRAKDDPEEMAEERRLFYVGLTRARNRVFLVRAERRNSYGTYVNCVPSRFLTDLPESLVKQQGIRNFARQVVWENNNWNRSPNNYRAQPKPTTIAPVEMKYQATMRVEHPVWGEGIVLESRVEDGEETVDINFESVGLKRLVASLANLTIHS